MNLQILYHKLSFSLFVRMFVFVLVFGPERILAHPMPNSIVLLDIQPDGVAAELQLPLSELQLALGQDVMQHPETLVKRLRPQLAAYLRQHIRLISPESRNWTVAVRNLEVKPIEESISGPYQELTAHLWLQPPSGSSSRTFTLFYDVIIHQLVTHTALVSIRQDWEAGVHAEHPVEVGVIRLDVVNNTIPPLQINQEKGGLWSGFKNMVALGLKHISAGTDHLLFLLVLLLPAPLLAGSKRWGNFGGIRYSIGHLLKVVTAFTIGHSLTLLAGAIGLLRLPSQPVEILIAFSILISAIHAIRPLFPGREAYVAAGFGLIHGLAFAGTLTNLNLAAQYMALSILGFNLGIELMQLLVVVLVVPWLLLLSQTRFYTGVRLMGAISAAVAALGWILERTTEKINPITALVEHIAGLAPIFLIVLAITSVVGFYGRRLVVKE